MAWKTQLSPVTHSQAGSMCVHLCGEWFQGQMFRALWEESVQATLLTNSEPTPPKVGSVNYQAED